jgi:hypothetical protein
MKTPQLVLIHWRQVPPFAPDTRSLLKLLCLAALLGSFTTALTQEYSFSTLAGLAATSGANDGTGSTARFNGPSDIAVDGAGNLFVADNLNDTIRKITSAGVVSTLAGSPGQAGSTDGTGGAARFNWPGGVAVDGAGNVFVADTVNQTIRKITSDGMVTTVAGRAGQAGSGDGWSSMARFRWPYDVAVDSAGNLFVADGQNHTIRKITSGGMVTTLAGSPGQSGHADGTGSAARFFGPCSIDVDHAGNLFVADYDNHAIRKVTRAGVVTTLVASAATFSQPEGVAVDSAGHVYASDRASYVIYQVMNGGTVKTLAGLWRISGSADGTGTAARFGGPYGLAVESAGILYVADGENHTIRKGVPAIDAGLRAYDGTVVIKLALETSDQPTSPVRISKGTANYGIVLVPTDSPDASKFRIQTSSGTKALRKLP